MATANIRQTETYLMKTGETALNQFTAAVLNTAADQQCQRAGAAKAGNIAGVLLDATHAAGTYARYQVSGVAKLVASAAISRGDAVVIAGVTGKGMAYVEAPGDSDVGIIGYALTAASADGDVIEVQLTIPITYNS